MGQQQGKTATSTPGESIWFNYLNQIKSSERSDISPFYKIEISSLEKAFSQLDKKNTKSIQLKNMQQIPFINEHPLFQRIIMLFEEQLKKIKTKKISIEIFLHLLTVFHCETDIQQKYRFLFRLYDWDKDFKIGYNDLVESFRLIFREKMHQLGQNGIKNMANEAIDRYGKRGQIKLEQFMELIPDDEVREVMSFRFTKKY